MHACILFSFFPVCVFLHVCKCVCACLRLKLWVLFVEWSTGAHNDRWCKLLIAVFPVAECGGPCPPSLSSFSLSLSPFFSVDQISLLCLSHYPIFISSFPLLSTRLSSSVDPNTNTSGAKKSMNKLKWFKTRHTRRTYVASEKNLSVCKLKWKHHKTGVKKSKWPRRLHRSWAGDGALMCCPQQRWIAVTSLTAKHTFPTFLMPASDQVAIVDTLVNEYGLDRTYLLSSFECTAELCPNTQMEEDREEETETQKNNNHSELKIYLRLPINALDPHFNIW